MRRRATIVLLGTLLLVEVSQAAEDQSKEQVVVKNRKLALTLSSERSRGSVVDTIMIHFCSDVVNNPQSPYKTERILSIFRRYKVSCHYLIDREGRVLLLVDEDRKAWHAGKGMLPWAPDRKNRLNDHSIGIELMGIGTYPEMKEYMSASDYNRLPKEQLGFTDAQYASLRRLIADICDRHKSINFDRKHIIGHDEYAPERKTDPGRLFEWNRIGLSRERKINKTD